MSESNPGSKLSEVELNKIVQLQIKETLSAEAANYSGSPRLVDYFYDKLFYRFIAGTSIASGILLAAQTASVSPPIEDPWQNFGTRAVATVAGGIGGAAGGFITSLVGGIAGSVAVLYWKDIVRHSAKIANRFIL